MGKFRSKLKRNTKGKTLSRGMSSTSNPKQMRHRSKAKSRFFQTNLSLATPEVVTNSNTLTLEAVHKHEERQAYNAETTTVNDVAGSLRSFTLDNDDETMSESQMGTLKTFASSYSSCTNMSFKKLLTNFRTSSELHKEMLGVLTALTEIIKERGGSESSTEYFILLMEQIKVSTEDNDIIAGVALLAMGIKSVPAAVLRKRFGEAAQSLLTCLQRFVESINQTGVKNVIYCLSVLLRAQDYISWTYSSNWQYIDAILSLTIHSKPKIRKAAQHAVVSIIQGSYFMLPDKLKEDMDGSDVMSIKQDGIIRVKYHPGSSRVAKFCLNQFKPEISIMSHTTVLYTVTLLKDTLSGLKNEDIRNICEHMLSIMSAANVLLRIHCFQALHSLFAVHSENLTGALCAKLLAAINKFRPDRTDIRQTVAWLTVLKEGYINLAKLDLSLCMSSLPAFMEVCVTDLWMSNSSEIIHNVSNSIKELLYDCVKSACNTQLADIYQTAISRILGLFNKVLNAPFGDVSKYIVLTFSIIFEVCGEYFSSYLMPALQTLFKRYDTQSSLRIQIEHSIIAGIKVMGPEVVLGAIPLTNVKGEVLLERAWLLPLLREGASGASFLFFKNTVLPMALNCNIKWHKYAEEDQKPLSHTYELLCCQLWGLFPGFCRKPKDPENFHLLAPTLGNALDNNPEFRAPILDGFMELLENSESVEIHAVLAKYSKNFVPRLLDIYTQKPTGTFEAHLRTKALEVVKVYLLKTPNDVLEELYGTAENQLTVATVGTFEYDAIFNVTATLLLFQKCETIQNFLYQYMVPVLKNDRSKFVSKDEQKLRKQQRRTYEVLCDILTSEWACCQKFTQKNQAFLQKLLLDTFATSCSLCQVARLKCLKILIENRKELTSQDKIVMKTIPETILSYKEFSTRKENISEDIIKIISNLFNEEGKLNDFIDILTAGLTGDDALITNTILAFRIVLQNLGQHITISTLQFVLEQVSVFLVQKSRGQAEASVAFLITFIKVMPSPLIANHLESIMRSLSAMTKDTKRYCRIQIGYLLKKLCKRFPAEDLVKFVPGDDIVTHRRLQKIRKQMRRQTRQKVHEDKSKVDEDYESEEEFIVSLKKKSITIDDILADSDLSDEIDVEGGLQRQKPKSKSNTSTFIREDPEDIVDLADIESMGNVLTNRPIESTTSSTVKSKKKDVNRGFKTADDGRLIISYKALRGKANDDADSETGDDDDSDIGATIGSKHAPKRSIEIDSSDENEAETMPRRKRKSVDTISMRSGKSTASRYTTGGKGIHRALNASDAASTKYDYPSKLSKSLKSTQFAHIGADYATKKAMGDIKRKGKLDPYAYIPLSRNTLNKRKRGKQTGTFKSILNGARKSE